MQEQEDFYYKRSAGALRQAGNNTKEVLLTGAPSNCRTRVYKGKNHTQVAGKQGTGLPVNS